MFPVKDLGSDSEDVGQINSFKTSFKLQNI